MTTTPSNPSTSTAATNGTAPNDKGAILRKVKCADIVVVKGFNAREAGAGVNRTASDIVDLADDIKKNGQQTPVRLRAVTVAPEKPGDKPQEKLMLVAGERRLVAIRDVLKQDTIDASIATMAEDAAVAEMLTENVRRRNLRPWEIAEGAAKLATDYGWTGERVAERIGLSKSYTQNLIRLRQKLAPELYKIFKGPAAGGETSATSGAELPPAIDFLVSLCKHPHAEQLAMYAKKQAGEMVDTAGGGGDDADSDGDGGGGDTDSGKKGKKGKKPVRRAKIEQTLLYDLDVATGMIGAKGEPDGDSFDERDRIVAKRVLSWVLGHFATKKGQPKPLVTVPVKDEEKAAAKKGAKKGAKKTGTKKSAKKTAAAK